MSWGFSQHAIHWLFCWAVLDFPHSITVGREWEKKNVGCRYSEQGLRDWLIFKTPWLDRQEHSVMSYWHDSCWFNFRWLFLNFFTVITISSLVQRSAQEYAQCFNWQCWFTFGCSRGWPHVFIHLLLFSTPRPGLGNGADLTAPSRRLGFHTCSPHAFVLTIAGLHSLLIRFW